MDEHTWDTVDRLVDWLDHATGLPPDTRLLLRVLKLSEELGETSQAVTGTLESSPRAQATHTWQDIENELCDVILTALVALATIDNHGARAALAARPGAALWPDTARPAPTVEQWLRTLTERVGKVAQSTAGVLGGNPRKGLTHTWADVQEGLCDVVAGAAGALSAVNPAARKVFAERLELVASRSLRAHQPH